MDDRLENAGQTIAELLDRTGIIAVECTVATRGKMRDLQFFTDERCPTK